MRIQILFICLFYSFCVVPAAMAGGAAAMKNQGQMIQQRKIIQQQQIQKQMQMQQIQQQRAIQRAQQEAVQQQVQQRAKAAAEQARDVVGLEEIVNVLDQTGQAWALVIDMEAKEAIVGHYIQKFSREGVRISKSPYHYVNLIDSMSQGSPNMLNRPFDQILRVVAVLEYDFSNGQNKDDMALKVLGSPQAVHQNKQRLGMQSPLISR